VKALALTRRAVVASAGAALSLHPPTAMAQDEWDTQPEVRPTEAVVAADLLHGPHYTLDPTVTTYAYLNRYTVASDYGPFVAPSDARLRRLLREIAAIAELKAMQDTDAFKTAAKEAGKSSLRSAKSLIDDPVGTLSAVPEGISSIFDRAGEALRRGGRSQYEDDPAKQMLAVSSYKRELAAKLSVDVYSSNEVLQKELNRLAWASAAGNLSLGAVSMATGAVVLKAASDVRLLEQARNLVTATPPSELSKRNRETLRRMQVPDAVANGFLQNRMLSPRHQTIIVASMQTLNDVPGRGPFIAFASGADTEDVALLFQQMAELMAGYAASVAPVRQVMMAANLPMVSAKDATVLLLPIDRLLWTERSARVAQNLANLQPHKPDIWMTGDASARAANGLQQLGLALTQQCGRQLPLLD
jgi:hypothetical protein